MQRSPRRQIPREKLTGCSASSKTYVGGPQNGKGQPSSYPSCNFSICFFVFYNQLQARAILNGTHTRSCIARRVDMQPLVTLLVASGK